MTFTFDTLMKLPNLKTDYAPCCFFAFNAQILEIHHVMCHLCQQEQHGCLEQAVLGR